MRRIKRMCTESKYRTSNLIKIQIMKTKFLLATKLRQAKRCFEFYIFILGHSIYLYEEINI
jgi:hypothetical protein